MHITVRSTHAKGALSFHAKQHAPFIRRLIPWTRIVEWGRGFQTAVRYVHQNELEAQGLIPYRQQTSRSSTTSAGPAP